MKILIPLILAVLFAFGCAQAPVATSSFMATLEPGCIRSETAGHSYQSAVDPKDVFDNWTEMPKLRKGDQRLLIISYRNPDTTSNTPVVILIKQRKRVIGYSLLQKGKLKVYVRDRKINCYLEMKIEEKYQKVFIRDLYAILGGVRI